MGSTPPDIYPLKWFFNILEKTAKYSGGQLIIFRKDGGALVYNPVLS